MSFVRIAVLSRFISGFKLRKLKRKLERFKTHKEIDEEEDI